MTFLQYMCTKTRKIADLIKASTVKTKGKVYIAVLASRQLLPKPLKLKANLWTRSYLFEYYYLVLFFSACGGLRIRTHKWVSKTGFKTQQKIST